MLERYLQEYLFDNPDVLFPNQAVRNKQKEAFIEGRRIDLLFEVDDTKYIIEIKRDAIRRQDIGQVCEYYGLMRRSKPLLKFRMILVSPTIPDYRRIFLEEIGIRCVEVQGPPESAQERKRLRKDSETYQKRERTETLATIGDFNLNRITFEDLLPPVSPRSMQLSHSLLIDSSPCVEKAYSEYEILPVRMVKPNQPDVLCVPVGGASSEYKLVGAGAWWAYSFGHSEKMAKNNVPNISVNALPWGLDFAINAELQTSQQVLRSRVAEAPESFDRVVSEHGSLRLQMWLKFEFQPRLYYWILLPEYPSGKWTSRDLLNLCRRYEIDFPSLRTTWVAWIKAHGKDLTSAQSQHLDRRNKNLNLALRLVSTFNKLHRVWNLSYREQIREFDKEYCRLKPLIEFFQ